MKLIFMKICVSKPIKWARSAELKSEKFIGSPSTFCSRVKWCGDYDLIDWCRAHIHTHSPLHWMTAKIANLEFFSEHRASCISKTRATRLSTLNRNSGIFGRERKVFFLLIRSIWHGIDDWRPKKLLDFFVHLLLICIITFSDPRARINPQNVFSPPHRCAPACLHYRDWIFRVARGSFTHLHQCISLAHSASLIWWIGRL